MWNTKLGVFFFLIHFDNDFKFVSGVKHLFSVLRTWIIKKYLWQLNYLILILCIWIKNGFYCPAPANPLFRHINNLKKSFAVDIVHLHDGVWKSLKLSDVNKIWVLKTIHHIEKLWKNKFINSLWNVYKMS